MKFLRFLENFPKKVLISLGVITGSLVLFLILFLTIGFGQVDADSQRRNLIQEIDKTKKDLAQAKLDRQYLAEHKDRFEELMKSDKLVPHTRRVAILELQRLGLANGLTALNFAFKSAGVSSIAAAQSQPKGDSYRVSIEGVDMKVGAPIDGDIYRFVRDATGSFPGSLVMQSLKLTRAGEVTSEMLATVSRGRDAGIVSGNISMIWRTAQAQEKPAGSGK